MAHCRRAWKISARATLPTHRTSGHCQRSLTGCNHVNIHTRFINNSSARFLINMMIDLRISPMCKVIWTHNLRLRIVKFFKSWGVLLGQHCRRPHIPSMARRFHSILLKIIDCPIHASRCSCNPPLPLRRLCKLSLNTQSAFLGVRLRGSAMPKAQVVVATSAMLGIAKLHQVTLLNIGSPGNSNIWLSLWPVNNVVTKYNTRTLQRMKLPGRGTHCLKMFRLELLRRRHAYHRPRKPYTINRVQHVLPRKSIHSHKSARVKAVALAMLNGFFSSQLPPAMFTNTHEPCPERLATHALPSRLAVMTSNTSRK